MKDSPSSHKEESVSVVVVSEVVVTIPVVVVSEVVVSKVVVTISVVVVSEVMVSVEISVVLGQPHVVENCEDVGNSDSPSPFKSPASF